MILNIRCLLIELILLLFVTYLYNMNSLLKAIEMHVNNDIFTIINTNIKNV